MKKNAKLKIGVDSELEENIIIIAETIGIKKTQLIRGILWRESLKILSDLRSKKGIIYVLTIKNGREFLEKEEVNNKWKNKQTN